MKTICSLIVTLFVVAVLVANAAAHRPTLSVSCEPTDCSGNVTLDFSNLDPSATYDFVGVTTGDSTGTTIIPDGSGSASWTEAFLIPGTWEFTLTKITNRGPAHHPVIDDFYCLSSSGPSLGMCPQP